MYRLKDIKKLKLDELTNIAKSKEIALGKKATKASIIDLLVASGFVKSELVQRDEIQQNNTISFEKVERYEILTEDNVQQLPLVTYEHIYQFCCYDNMSFKALDRAHKHKDAVIYQMSKYARYVL
jgi:hypothetical protein